MAGKMYCVGVGPGDPELITVKAVKVMEAVDVIVCPVAEQENGESTAYKIASQACEKLSEKKKLPIYTPMVLNAEERMRFHREAAGKIEELLDQGLDVAYLTLGDPTIYCTYTALNDLLSGDGYKTEYIPGVPSFCAAAARLGISLVDGRETLKLIPAAVSPLQSGIDSDESGNLVFMKTSSHMDELKQLDVLKNRDVYGISDCGMETEKVYYSAEEIPETAGYFTLVIAKQ